MFYSTGPRYLHSKEPKQFILFYAYFKDSAPMRSAREYCTIDLLFDWFGISCMTTGNFCFYLQNRLIQTRQTGGQQYSDTFLFSIPWICQAKRLESSRETLNFSIFPNKMLRFARPPWCAVVSECDFE
jgi:hypothetical protein